MRPDQRGSADRISDGSASARCGRGGKLHPSSNNQRAPRVAPPAIHGRLILASALVRSDWPADAKRVVREVRMLDAGLTLGRFAQAQPYRDETVIARIVEDLRTAGLPG
jgi:hypothetical protein